MLLGNFWEIPISFDGSVLLWDDKDTHHFHVFFAAERPTLILLISFVLAIFLLCGLNYM